MQYFTLDTLPTIVDRYGGLLIIFQYHYTRAQLKKFYIIYKHITLITRKKNYLLCDVI